MNIGLEVKELVSRYVQFPKQIPNRPCSGPLPRVIPASSYPREIEAMAGADRCPDHSAALTKMESSRADHAGALCCQLLDDAIAHEWSLCGDIAAPDIPSDFIGGKLASAEALLVGSVPISRRYTVMTIFPLAWCPPAWDSVAFKLNCDVERDLRFPKLVSSFRDRSLPRADVLNNVAVEAIDQT